MHKSILSRWRLWGFVSLFLAPWILALGLYYSPAARWLTPKTQGILLTQPKYIGDLPLITVSGQSLASMPDTVWRWLYVQPTSCDDTCQTTLNLLHNARISLGRDQGRITLHCIQDPTHTKQSAMLSFLTPGTLAMVDPQGWLMLYYPPAIDYQGVLSDLKRLLKYSRQG